MPSLWAQHLLVYEELLRLHYAVITKDLATSLTQTSLPMCDASWRLEHKRLIVVVDKLTRYLARRCPKRSEISGIIDLLFPGSMLQTSPNSQSVTRTNEKIDLLHFQC